MSIGFGSSAGVGGTAVGYGATAGVNSVAVGSGAIAQGPNDVAVGYHANDGASGGVAIGANASISHLANNAVALGSGATIGPNGANSVAIGAGSVANDPNVVSFGSPGAERRLTNVAAAINNTDAPNYGQVKKAYGGVALAFAMTAVSPSLNTGEQSISGGFGDYVGQQGYSFRYQARPRDNIFVGAAIGVTGTGEVGGSAGVGFKW